MDREQIKKILPHREPMLLVDSVKIKDGHSIGKYKVRGDEWFLQGHFPNNPVVPGVILCEIMAQSCCCLMADVINGRTTLFLKMDDVKFRGMVRPGDTIEIKSVLTSAKDPYYFTACQAYLQDGSLCAEGRFAFVLKG